MKPLISNKAFFISIIVIGILCLANFWYTSSKSTPVVIINAPHPIKVGEPGAPFTSAEAPLGFTGGDQPKPVSPSAPYSYVGAPGYETKPYTLKDMIPIYRARQLSMSPYFEPYVAPSE